MSIVIGQVFETKIQSVSANDAIYNLTVSFEQDRKIVVKKSFGDIFFDCNRMIVTLTPAETSLFVEGTAMVNTRAVLAKATVAGCETIRVVKP